MISSHLEVKREGTTKTFNDESPEEPCLFYVLMCVSWFYEVLKWVIMMFIISLWSFMKFGHQMSKTLWINPLRSSCVSWVCHVCLEVFHVFILGENCLESLQHVKVYIHVGNARVQILKGHAKGPQEGPKGCRDTTFATSIDWMIRRPIFQKNGSLMVVSMVI